MKAQREERLRVGLCFDCRHSRTVSTPRSRFWLCRLAATDPRFEKYPRLPVLACDGYEAKGESEPDEAAPGGGAVPPEDPG